MFRVTQNVFTTVSEPAVSANPNIAITKGPIQFFRDKAESTSHLLYEPRLLPRSPIVCLLVPAYISIADIVALLEPFLPQTLDTVRICLDEGQSVLCILHFKAQDLAEKFHTTFHLKPFSNKFHEFLLVFFLDTFDGTPGGRRSSLPSSSNVQLPTCPLCLERLDSSISGQISTMCDHSSTNCDCIRRSQCKVCVLTNQGHSHCAECEATEHVWVCLVCAYEGCGRYGQQHALQHYKRSSHSFAIDLESQRIWDYENDRYVHRVIYNRSSNQVDFLPDSEDQLGFEKAIVDSKLDAKLVQVHSEYSHTLAMQLESQRMHFMDRLGQMKRSRDMQVAKLKRELQNAQRAKSESAKEVETLKALKTTNDELVASTKKQTSECLERIRRLQEETNLLMQQRDQIKEKFMKFLREQEQAKRQTAQQIQDLKQEITDLQTHLKTLRALERHPDRADIEDGVIISTVSTSSGHQGPKKGWRSKR